MKNFLPEQYRRDKKLKIKHNYLSEQFSDKKIILKKISKIVKNNDFTLGEEVNRFENNFKNLIKSKYCIAVGSGTDAIYLSLKALGIKPGDEVITTAFTFYATIGAIVQSGAKPVFVDIQFEDHNIDPNKIEKAITKRTKAIVPVHWSGKICDMEKISKIAKKYNLFLVEDACHAVLAKRGKKFAGNFGHYGCFSMHPLKNLNIWGDGGMVVTNNFKLAKKLYLLRNHGLINRNQIEIFGTNSRLDTIQAVVANHLLKKLHSITKKRISNAKFFDKKLKIIPKIELPKRNNSKEVFHIYSFLANSRDKLIEYLISQGIDAKKHYPVAMHLQKPSKKNYGYKKGDFKIAEEVAQKTISLPVHEFLKKKDLIYIVKKIKKFYNLSKQ
tara:strand:- start:3653 stop:4807 length:1155 start_codon:yes stop_codon:yes gene_type:complete